MKKWRNMLKIAGILAMLGTIPAYAGGWQWMDANGDNVK